MHVYLQLFNIPNTRHHYSLSEKNLIDTITVTRYKLDYAGNIIWEKDSLYDVCNVFPKLSTLNIIPPKTHWFKVPAPYSLQSNQIVETIATGSPQKRLYLISGTTKHLFLKSSLLLIADKKINAQKSRVFCSIFTKKKSFSRIVPFLKNLSTISISNFNCQKIPYDSRPKNTLCKVLYNKRL